MDICRVAQSPVCKMPIRNLAKVFGPTIVGYSSMELGRNDMYNETTQQTQVGDLPKIPFVITQKKKKFTFQF